MWKVTSWQFRKCVTYCQYWVLKFLNGSYCCSKSQDSENLGSLANLKGWKKTHSQNPRSRAAIRSAFLTTLFHLCWFNMKRLHWSLNLAFWTHVCFYQTQVSLGSNLWVWAYVTQSKRFCRLNYPMWLWLMRIATQYQLMMSIGPS